MKKKIFLALLLIVFALCAFTACSEVDFKINFVVDGKIYYTVNTSGSEKIKMPENPIKDDYTFDGWYWDNDVWEKPFTANSLLDAPLSSDMSVYAKFTKKHEHNYTAVITAPTCTERGYTTHTCDCGDSYIDDYIDELGHDFGAWIETTAPTCTTKGVETRYCSRDNTHIETREINALGHTPETAVEENRQEPKCNIKGGYDLVVYCKTCGAELSREHKEIAALTHEFTNYVSDKNATYDNDGTKTAYCNHGCGEKHTVTDVGTKLQSGIAFKTLAVDGNNVYGKIPNAQTEFDFLTEIEKKGNVTYDVSRNLAGDDIIVSKTAEPSEGDNKYYILVYQNNELLSRYNVTIRRREMYDVTFNTDGGTAVAPQRIEEDNFATEPTTTRSGYTFTGWDYIFDNSITGNTVITASWTANKDTKYKVEYYLQNLADDNYTLECTDNLTGTTNTTANAEIKTFEHFTHTTISNSVERANINCDETTRLKVYYTRDKYTIKLVASDNVTLNRTYNGEFKYGYQIEEITATVNNYLGYEWKGWHNGDNVLTYDKVISAFTVKEDLNYTADFAVKGEMQNFNFTSTTTECEITGVKNNNITEIIIPDYITSIGEYVFSGCSSLKEITIPDSVTSIGSSAFYGCSSLTSITIPFVGSSINTSEIFESVFGYVFGYTTGLFIDTDRATYQISSGSRTYYYYIPANLKTVTVTGGNVNAHAFYNCSSLTSITIPDSVTSIGAGAFSNCRSLTSITIPDSVTSIGSGAFWGCRSLTSITIPDNVTSIEVNTFNECTSLTSIIIPKGVTSIGESALSGCSSLTSITIPDSVTSIGSYAFKGCSDLTRITVASTNPNYKSIDGNLYSKDGTTLIKYATGKTATEFTIPNSVISIGSLAFSDCHSLTSVNIPDSVTSIGGSAFSNCDSLTIIKIPDSVKSIGSGAFSNCDSLTSITIPDSVTSIKWATFEDCSNLNSVIIPKSVIIIETYAFNNCNNLSKVYYKGTSGTWAKISIAQYNGAIAYRAYYYSETEPELNDEGTTYNGKFWHYDTDGITPVIWVKED